MDEVVSPIQRFADDLDELLETWREKPADDRLNLAEVAGVLMFRLFTLFDEARSEWQSQTEGED